MPGYHYYYNFDEIINLDNDPLMKFDNDNGYVVALPAKNVDWIIKNIFNLDPDHSINDDRVYYKDEYYYFMFFYGGSIGHNTVIKEKTALNDGKYSVICDFYSFVNENKLLGTVYMTVDLKEINGNRYWSFYKIIYKFKS